MGVAVATWIGAALSTPIIVAAVWCGLVVAVATRRLGPLALVLFCALGMASGLAAEQRLIATKSVEVPIGRVSVQMTIAEEPTASTFGLAVASVTGWGGIPWNGPKVAVRSLPDEVSVGARVEATGVMHPGIRRVRDEVVAAIIDIARVDHVRDSGNPFVVVGNAARDQVTRTYDGSHRGDGLLSGFLIGATDAMPASEVEALRRAGLAHFVAVSGSNVALFLGMWWLATFPLAIHRRVRVLVGVVGLVLFVVITRWEPSVVRASAMASVVLAGASIGVPVDPWMALGVAVTALVLFSGDLVFSVGFQLSVLATVGVLAGLLAAHGRSPRWLFVALFSTIGAQIAVAPLLVAVFGEVPLLSPLSNLVAGPVIWLTTVLAAIGVVVPPVAWLARIGSATVLLIADAAAGGPQLGWRGLLLVGGMASAMLLRPIRMPAIALACLALVALQPWHSPWPESPIVVALDIGQGDAMLVQDPSGASMLVDGGSDPLVLNRALRRHGVERVDLVVVSHDDLDHAGGLVELMDEGRAGQLMVSAFLGASEVVAAARRGGVPVREVMAGDRFSVGSVRVEVLSPSRRYLSDNDGSVVLLVSAAGSVLLPGDIESVAQRDLPLVHPDVLVVPHHGSATTDLRWLRQTIGSVGVMSYGPNRYGHPHLDVVSALAEAGAQVWRTEEGDVVMDLSDPTVLVTQNR